MSAATVKTVIDRWNPKKDRDNPQKKVCAVSIRVTFERKRKYYATGINLTINEFTKIMEAKRRSDAESKIYNKIRSFESKTIDIIEKLPVFTFVGFEKMYIENRGATDTLAYWFDKYIEDLTNNGKIGTATCYRCAKNSLEKFKSGLKFADVSAGLLKKYENWMLNNDPEKPNSKTTVSMYLRCLRCLFNQAGLTGDLYPFSRGQNDKGKYKIPKSKKSKRALSFEEVHSIYHFNTGNNSNLERAKDYWYFAYLINGINIKDMLRLKYKNIEKGSEGEFIKFERAKTEDTQDEETIIRASLKPVAKKIIEKWGQKAVNGDAYIFPHLKKGMPPIIERQIVQQLTKFINKNIKLIAKEVGITQQVTSLSARHSFATILKNAGVSTEFISEALGHSNLRTTKTYLGSFGAQAIHRVTDVLQSNEVRHGLTVNNE